MMSLLPLITMLMALSGNDIEVPLYNENHTELVDQCTAATEEKFNWQYRGINWDPNWSLTYYNRYDGDTTIIARGDDAAGIVYWADCEYRDGQLHVLDIAPGPFENDVPEDL